MRILCLQLRTRTHRATMRKTIDKHVKHPYDFGQLLMILNSTQLITTSKIMTCPSRGKDADVVGVLQDPPLQLLVLKDINSPEESGDAGFMDINLVDRVLVLVAVIVLLAERSA